MKNKGKIRGQLDVINPIMHLFNHLFADKHTHWHRIGFGLIVMILGTTIQFTLHTTLVVVDILLHTIGGSLHGIGLIPIADAGICLVKKSKPIETKN